MELFRIIHHKHYDRAKKRFRSTAFSNSSNNGGISLIQPECIQNSINTDDETTCDHILEYYPSIAGHPIIYWIISTEDIHEKYADVEIVLEDHPSHTGDECHRNLKGLTDNKAKKIFYKYCKPPNLLICNNGEPTEIRSFNQIKNAIE